MSFTVELGRGVLRCSSSRLDAKLVTSISVAVPPTSTHQQWTQTKVSDCIQSEGALVFHGSRFRILFDITTLGPLLTPADRDMLAEGIIKAQAWDQLGISLSLLRDDSSVDGLGSIQIACGCSNHPPRPPNDLLNFELNLIQFSITICRPENDGLGNQRKRYKRSHDNRSHDLLTVASARYAYDISMKFCRSEHGSENNDEWLCSAESIFFADELAVDEHKMLQTVSVPSDSHKRGRDLVDDDYPAQRRSSNKQKGLASLVDTAMRISIFRSPGRLPFGITVLETAFLRKLVDVSPLLWDPARNASFSRTIPFLSILSRSIGQCINLGAKSPSVKSKLNGLHSLSSTTGLEEHTPNSATPGDRNGTVFNMLESRLWRYAQNNLTGRKTARHLESFVLSDSGPGLRNRSDEDVPGDGFFQEISLEESDYLVDDEVEATLSLVTSYSGDEVHMFPTTSEDINGSNFVLSLSRDIDAHDDSGESTGLPGHIAELEFSDTLEEEVF